MNFPILMIPHFRCGRETPWAGNTLHRLYEKYTLGNQIGESYDFCTLAGFESTAPDGTPLSSFVSSPFTIKWVDAKEAISIHIHPHHDEYLIVVQADADAKIVTGLKDGICADNLENMLQHSPEDTFEIASIKIGDVIHIPAGTAHSFSGATCYQIQTNNTEFLRIYDWDRTNSRGQKRPLQIEKAIDHIKTGHATKLSDKHYSQLIQTDDFTVSALLDCNEKLFPAAHSFSVLTCLEPSIIKIENNRTLYLCAGQTLLIPGDCVSFTITGKHFFLAAARA